MRPPVAGGAARSGLPELDVLEAERDFLLRSLEDLDAERHAGELSDPRYRDLHDQYTIRTATVLRAIARLQAHGDDGVADENRPSLRRSRARLVVAGALVLALVGVGGALLVRSAVDRQPGATITGNAQSSVSGLDALARAARDRPDDAQAQLDHARALLRADRAVDALKAFDVAARLDPTNPAPRAYAGWILFLAGLTDQAVPRLDAAVALDPAYPDARFFRGMVLLRGRDDRAGALSDLREYLRLQPPGPERTAVQALVGELEQGRTGASQVPGS